MPKNKLLLTGIIAGALFALGQTGLLQRRPVDLSDMVVSAPAVDSSLEAKAVHDSAAHPSYKVSRIYDSADETSAKVQEWYAPSGDLKKRLVSYSDGALVTLSTHYRSPGRLGSISVLDQRFDRGEESFRELHTYHYGPDGAVIEEIIETAMTGLGEGYEHKTIIVPGRTLLYERTMKGDYSLLNEFSRGTPGDPLLDYAP